MKAQVAIIADDLTGAADTGVTFAQQGLSSSITWKGHTLPEADVVVLSTESRHSPQAEAVRRTRSAAQQIRAAGGANWIYKKIDSTLRGHPGAELAEIMHHLDMPQAVVAPAFPAQGRTTLGGQHYVHGIPLHETTFGKVSPTSDVAHYFTSCASRTEIRALPINLIRQTDAAILAQLKNSDWRIMIADAETNKDLTKLMTAVQQSHLRLLCGSAGLAQALAQSQVWISKIHPPPQIKHTGQGIIIVAGSRHPQTLHQIQALAAQNIPIVQPGVAWFTNTDPPLQPLVHNIAAKLKQHGCAVLTTAGLPHLPQKSQMLAAHLGQLTRALIEYAPPKGLVLTGGDITIAVGNALAADAFWVYGEVQPGIPWSTLMGGLVPGLPLVTKAGGFGDQDTLLKAIRHLNTL